MRNEKFKINVKGGTRKISSILIPYFSFRQGLIFILICSYNMLVHAQKISTAQLWTDYLLDYPFKKVNLFETEFSYRTLLSNDIGLERWHSLNLTPTYERSESKYISLITALRLSYTLQNDTSRSFEIRPMIGVRLFFTPDSRFQTRLTIRYEHRFFKFSEEHGWESSTRTRIRPELVFPINKSSFFVDKMLYVLTDVEFFLTLDDNVKEAFSNRIRNRLGLGYRFSYNFRLEGIYILQRSRNEINTDFSTRDNILDIRFRMFLPFKHEVFSRNNTGAAEP